MSLPIRVRAAILFFRSTQRTKFVEDLEILLFVKFRWIWFCGFREKSRNVSANQKLGWPSCFSDRHKNTNLSLRLRRTKNGMPCYIVLSNSSKAIDQSNLSPSCETALHTFVIDLCYCSLAHHTPFSPQSEIFNLPLWNILCSRLPNMTIWTLIQTHKVNIRNSDWIIPP